MGPTARRALVVSVVTAVLAVGAGGVALAQQTEATPAEEKVTLYVGIDSDLTSLNPFNTCCGPDYEYLYLNYDLGIAFSPEDLSPMPWVVTSWEHSDDYMTWTLKVRDDVTWHDGQPLTAEDVAFTYQFIADYQMPFFKDYVPFDPTFEAPDPTTVIWRSSEPTFAPTIPPWIYILPKHVWGRFTTVSDDPKEVRKAAKEFENFPPVGSGPFKLVEWEKGQFFRFEANENWWGGPPKALDEIVFKVYGSQEAMAQALRSGEIDFAEGLNPTLFNALKDEPNIATHVADAGCWGNIAFNFGGQGPEETHHPAIEDLRVRQAIAHAIDKQAIVDKVYLGTATVGDSILLPTSNAFYYHDIPPELEYPHDPARANQILDEAGYLDTDGDGVREMPDGTNPLVLELMVITDVSGSVDTGKLVRGFLDEIGIKVKLKVVNTNKAYDLWFNGDWDAYAWDWCPDPDPDFMLSVFTTDQCLGWSDGCYSDPTYDAMYEEQRTLLDREERRQLVVRMQEYIAEQVPIIVLNYWSDLQAYRTDRFTGYVKTPDKETGLLLFGWGPQSYLNLVPVAAEEGGPVGAPAQPGLPGWVWAAIIGGIVVVVGGAALIRRGRREEERA